MSDSGGLSRKLRDVSTAATPSSARTDSRAVESTAPGDRPEGLQRLVNLDAGGPQAVNHSRQIADGVVLDADDDLHLRHRARYGA